jgi:hypothetical protein
MEWSIYSNNITNSSRAAGAQVMICAQDDRSNCMILTSTNQQAFSTAQYKLDTSQHDIPDADIRKCGMVKCVQ